MERDEIIHLADKYAIAAERIVQWRTAYGRNKRKQSRPKGMLSIGDIGAKYGIQARTLAMWRREGLPSGRGKGKLVLIKEADLLEWISKKRQNK